MQHLAAKSWLVYAKRPFGTAEHVIKYLGRYTHRVGIANSRLIDVSDRAVTFRTKNGANATLDPIVLLQRFVQHVLPDGFKKIRHAGLYAGAHVETKLVHAMRLCAGSAEQATADKQPELGFVRSWQEDLTLLVGRDFSRCPRCGGELVAQISPCVDPHLRDTS